MMDSKTVYFPVFFAICATVIAVRNQLDYSPGAAGASKDRSEKPGIYKLVGHEADSESESQCSYFADLTYRCEMGQCDVEPNYRGHRHLFMDSKNFCSWTAFKTVNCTSVRPVHGTWRRQDGLIRHWTYDSQQERVPQLIGTCIFFKTKWFECVGVANVTGTKPWRGYFDGSAKEGYRGSITNEAVIVRGCIDLRRSCTDGVPKNQRGYD